jgi:hypothetical protein
MTAELPAVPERGCSGLDLKTVPLKDIIKDSGENTLETRRAFLLQSVSAVAGLTALSRLPATELQICSRGDFDLGWALAAVRWELQAFELEYLPALLAPRFLDHDHGPPRLLDGAEVERAFGPGPVLDGIRQRAATLPAWQAAVRQLARALPGRRSSRAGVLDTGEIERLCATTYPELPELLDAPPAPVFALARGRLWWGIIPYGIGPDSPESLARQALGRLPFADANTPDPLGEIRRQLPRIRQWVLGLPPLSNENLAAMPGVVPAVALVDPDLPAVALDRQRMRAALLAGRGTSPERVAADLRAIDTHFFASCLCGALALTMQSLANNHFDAIGRLLHHPELYADAFWLGLAPKAVAAVLLWKVIALRALAGLDQQTTLKDRGRATQRALLDALTVPAQAGTSERESLHAGS